MEQNIRDEVKILANLLETAMFGEVLTEEVQRLAIELVIARMKKIGKDYQ